MACAPATNGGWVLGDTRFKQQIAEALGRRVALLAKGRPRKAKAKRRQLSLTPTCHSISSCKHRRVAVASLCVEAEYSDAENFQKLEFHQRKAFRKFYPLCLLPGRTAGLNALARVELALCELADSGAREEAAHTARAVGVSYQEMGPFIAIVAVFCLPVLAKAFGWAAFTEVCDPTLPAVSWRFLLPVVQALLGYLIFVLEGAQSSVILANKHSTESLARTLEGIDTSRQRRKQAERALNSSANHANIDSFLVGRQILIVLFGFLFKLAFDAASLTLSQLEHLRQHEAVCAVSAKTTLAIYSVLDNWAFSTILIALLVAYVFQVLPKLMAQNHPMRFLTTMPLAVYMPRVCEFLGRWSLLELPLRRLRKRGDEGLAEGTVPYLSKQREVMPIDGEQIYRAQVDQLCEAVGEMSVDLTKTDQEGQAVWLVSTVADYEVIVGAREFSHVIFPADAEDVTYTVEALVPNKVGVDGVVSLDSVQHLADRAETPVQAAYLKGRFNRMIPAGSQLAWRADFFMPIPPDGQLVFELPILKPIRCVKFYVEENWSSDPEVQVLALFGTQSPKAGQVTVGYERKSRFVTVDFPPVPCRLRFTF
jgi:hypothetical protein